LLAADKDLRRIVDEVDDVSKVPKSDASDEQTAKVGLHPSVWYAIKQTLWERELRYLALIDDLTCLYNRRGFFATATQQLRLARRNTQDLLLLFCDFDNLKEINDSYGHREGDLALIRAADALEQTFRGCDILARVGGDEFAVRGCDILARVGGDEFAVLALGASSQNQQAILSRLERNLEKSNANEFRYNLSLSVGVARFDPKQAVSLGELMAQADQTMYEQKRNKQKIGMI
jgi:GGDEF domain-containing protein